MSTKPKTFKSTILYYASWNSYTHVGGAYNLAKAMPKVLFHVVSAEKWPYPQLDNLIYHNIYRPNCAVRFDERLFLYTYPYEDELGDVKRYRKHFFSYTDLLEKIDPNLVITDTNIEVALWSKFMGFPTCIFYETVDTNNLRHHLAWDNVDSVLVRYPKKMIEQIEPNLHAKMFFTGGISSFDLLKEVPTRQEGRKFLGIKRGDKQKTVVYLSSSQAQNTLQARKYFGTICAALDQLKDTKCFVMYPKDDSVSRQLIASYPKLNFVVGIFNQTQYYISAADVVVAGAGLGATMETCFFRIPMLQIPVPWAIKEQMIKATALERIGATKVIDPVNMTEESIIAQVSQLLTDKELRVYISEKQKDIIDGKGYQRLARHINKMLASSYCINKSSIINN